jgi:hypothetical protein
MIIDSQAPLGFWGEEVNRAVYLCQQTPKEDLTNTDGRNGYQTPYATAYQIVQVIGKPAHDNDGNEISYKTPLLHHW